MRKYVIIIFGFLSTLAVSQNPVIEFDKISNTSGGFSVILDEGDIFGTGIDSIGDLNGDGQVDIAIGACSDDDGGLDRGAVYIVFLNSDGTVQSHQKISSLEGNFTGVLDDGDIFGCSVSSLGDLNNDGISDLAVGAEYDGDGGTWHGAVWILFLNSDGTVQAHQKISQTEGGFTGTLNGAKPTFGSDIANIGDLNGDGNVDIAVGSRRDSDGGTRRGAVWILFLNSDGTVNSHQKISDTEGNFNAVLEYEDYFGASLTNIGDLNDDGIVDLAVSAYRDDDGGTNRGAIYILFLNQDGTVNQWQKISDTQGLLNDEDLFGVSVATIGDLNNDGNVDIIAGAPGDDTGGTDKGAVYILNLNNDGTVQGYQKIAEGLNGFNATLNDGDFLGRSVASIGKVGQFHNFAAGASQADDGNINAGAVWLLSVKGDPVAIRNSHHMKQKELFPNPTDGIVHIPEGPNWNENTVSVFNIQGDQILKQTNVKSIDLSKYDKGLYLIQISYIDELWHGKIIKN